MSDLYFPSLPGQTWPLLKTPTFNTVIQTSVSGREKRCSLWSTPQWKFKIAFDYLELADFTTLLGFFVQHQGAAESFKLTDGATTYRVRFLQDTQEFENFADQLWVAKQVELISVK